MNPDTDERPRRYLLYASQVYALAILRPLQQAIRKQAGEVAWFFDGPGAQYLTPDERKLDTIDEVKTFAPEAVFVPGNSVPDFIPGVKVEVFHGFSVGKRSDSRGHFRIRGLFDLYCTQGSTTTPKFRELAERYGYFHVTETGWPKTDPLFREMGDGSNPWRTGWEAEAPTVLYASTFTQGLSSASLLRETIARLSREGRWNWLVTLHPKMPYDVVAAYRALQGPHLRFAETDDVVPLLKAADVMVSDTSSIVHEFLLLHKPVVTLRNSCPGPYLIDIERPDELEGALELALSRPPELIERIVEFAQAIHPYRDGRSSERVLEATREFLRDPSLQRRAKPLNLWRRLKLRARLGYPRWR